MYNHGRNNLVTRFKCSKCGNQLNLSYKKQDTANGIDEESDNMTGASKLENDIFIEPCRTCVSKPEKDLADLRRILGVE